jgi:hypothetical protein
MVEYNRPDVIYSVRLDSDEQSIEEDEIRIVDTTLKIQDDNVQENVEQNRKDDTPKKTLFEMITKTLLGRVITLNVAGIAGIIAYITVHATGNFKYICLR